MDWGASGAVLYVPHYLSRPAEGHTSRGHIEAGLAVLQEGWEAMDRTSEHAWHAEMSRLKGALLL